MLASASIDSQPTSLPFSICRSSSAVILEETIQANALDAMTKAMIATDASSELVALESARRREAIAHSVPAAAEPATASPTFPSEFTVLLPPAPALPMLPPASTGLPMLPPAPALPATSPATITAATALVEAVAGGEGSYESAALLPVDSVPSDKVEGASRSGMTLDSQPAGASDSSSTALAELVRSAAFSSALTSLVLINMGLMCMAYKGMSNEFAQALEQAQLAITWAFIGEMGLKLYAFGWSSYWADRWNALDGTIVSISIVEIVLTTLLASSRLNLSFLRILRMLRVLRVLRLMRSWKGLYKVVITFIKAIPQMTNLFILMLIFIITLSLLGMQVAQQPCPPRMRYHPVTHSSPVRSSSAVPSIQLQASQWSHAPAIPAPTRASPRSHASTLITSLPHRCASLC